MRTKFSQSVMDGFGRPVEAGRHRPDLHWFKSKVNGAYTVTCSCHSSCCQWWVMCQASSSSFNRTVLLHNWHERLLELATPAASIPPDRWPSNSPDLNAVDYKIWSLVQQRVYQSWVHNVDELKQRLVHIWHGIDQTITDNAIDEWRGRLCACVRAKGGHLNKCCDNIKRLIIQPCDNKRFICVNIIRFTKIISVILSTFELQTFPR